MTTYCCIIISSQITNHRVISTAVLAAPVVLSLKTSEPKVLLFAVGFSQAPNNQMQYLHQC